MKRKSISAEDLKNLLKKMINGALTDNDQMARLHHIICEEWYGNEITDVSGLKAHEMSSRESVREDAGDHLSVTFASDVRDVRCNGASSNSSCPAIANSHSDKHLPIAVEEIRDEIRDEMKDEIKDETIEAAAEGAEALEAEDLQAQKYDLTNWHPRNKLSFEEWKERKTAAYKQMLKNKKIEQEQMLNAIKAQKDRRKRALEEQEYLRLLSLERQRLYNKYIEEVKAAKMKNEEMELNARRMLNAQAFETWKRRKDAEMKQARMWMFDNCQRNCEGTRKMISPEMTEATAKFHSWLNQLNWVLHEKYVREHRHLVRSFYCQPTYYGAS